MNTGNTFVYLGADGSVEFGYYAKLEPNTTELTYRKIARGALSFRGGDAEILVAKEQGFFGTLDNKPGEEYATLHDVIQGVELLRASIDRGRQVRPPSRRRR